MTHRVRYPADLHAIGRLLHLFSKRIWFGPSWGKIAGVTGGLAWLLPPMDRESKGCCETMNYWTVREFKKLSHLVRAESMSKTSLARCFLCFCMLGMSTYFDTKTWMKMKYLEIKEISPQSFWELQGLQVKPESKFLTVWSFLCFLHVSVAFLYRLSMM